MQLAVTAIFVCAIYTLACFAVGSSALRLLIRERTLSGAAAGASAFLLGQGLIASILMLAATFGSFSQPLVVGVVIVSLSLGLYRQHALRIAASTATALPLAVRRFWRLPVGYKAIVVLTVFMIVRAVALAFIPPEPFGDAIAYYLVLAKAIADTGHIQIIPQHEPFAAFGMHVEMHYAALLSLANYPAAKLFAVPAALAASVLLVGTAHRLHIGWRGQIVALAILWTSTAFNRYVGDGKTDAYAIALGMAALYWALHIDEQPISRSAALLTGAFAAMAVIAKFAYLLVLPPFLLLITAVPYLVRVQRTALTRSLRPLLIPLAHIVIAGVVILLPHLIKNAVVIGEPFAPFTNLDDNARRVVAQDADDEDTIRRVFLGYPFYLTYAYAGNVDHVSVLVLAFTPLALMIPKARWRRVPLLSLSILAAITAMTCWLAFQPVVFLPRYFLIALVPFMLAAAWTADYWLRRHGSTAVPSYLIIPAAIITMSISHTDPLLRTTQQVVDLGWRHAVGELSDCDFEQGAGEGACDIAPSFNALAGAGERAWVISYSRFWLRSDLVICAARNVETRTMLRLHEMNDRWTYLYQRGIRYILYQPSVMPNLFEVHLPLVFKPDWLRLELIAENGETRLYSLDADDPPVEREVACRASRPGYWELVPAGER